MHVLCCAQSSFVSKTPPKCAETDATQIQYPQENEKTPSMAGTRCELRGKKLCRAWCAKDQNRDRAVCEHLYRFAAEHDRGNTSPAMRAHND